MASAVGSQAWRMDEMSEELQRFFGFTCDPFGPVGRPTTFVETERSLQLWRNIVRELAEGELILSVRGRPGSGKTILVAELARDLKAQHLEVLEQSGKSASPLGLQRTLADAAGVRDALITPDLIYLDLWGRPDSPPFVLLIDDADQLSTIMFRFLEVLMQFSRKHGNNLRIVLVGCYGIWAGLEDDDLDRLRIAAVSRYVIGPLDSADATAYLDGRLRLAGSSLRQVMTRRATVAFVDNVEALPSVLHAAMACVLREGHSQGCKRLTSQIVLAALGVTPAEHEATTSSRVLPLPAMAGGVAALAAAAVAFVVMHGYPAAEPHPTIAMSDAVSGPSSTARPDDISPGPPPRTTKLAAAVPGKPSAAVGTRSDPPSDAAALDPLLRAGLPPPGSDPAMTPASHRTGARSRRRTEHRIDRRASDAGRDQHAGPIRHARTADAVQCRSVRAVAI